MATREETTNRRTVIETPHPLMRCPLLSETLTGEPVGLRETDDGLFEVSYRPIMLGTIDKDYTFNARKPQPRG